jgi:hypothetical protein
MQSAAHSANDKMRFFISVTSQYFVPADSGNALETTRRQAVLLFIARIRQRVFLCGKA